MQHDKSLQRIINGSGKKQSGFFDLEKTVICNHPEHEPPKYLHIPQGQGYRHVCPYCGKTTTIIPPQVSL